VICKTRKDIVLSLAVSVILRNHLQVAFSKEATYQYNETQFFTKLLKLFLGFASRIAGS